MSTEALGGAASGAAAGMATGNPWAAVVGAGLGLVGGLIGSNSARRAAADQAAAARYAADQQLLASRENMDLQANALKASMQMQSPAIQARDVALSALMGGYGLGLPQTAYGGMTPGGTSQGAIGTYVNAQGQPVDRLGNPIASTDRYGLLGTNYGASNAEMSAAGSQYANMFTNPYSLEMFQTDPSYEFRRQEMGREAAAASNMAPGGRAGGQFNYDLLNRKAQLANTFFNQERANYYNRLDTRANQLANIAGLGSNAASGAANNLTSTASNIANTGMTGAANASNYLTQAANAGAAGTIGSTNALVGGLNSGLNNWYKLSQLNPSASTVQDTPPISGSYGMPSVYDTSWWNGSLVAPRD